MTISKKAGKTIEKMPTRAREAVFALVMDLRETGPVQHEWPHYGKLKGKKNCYHCHLNRGRPTYVVCWEVQNAENMTMEVCYAWTHENAPY